jgi:primosomal protein N' (replication factor Y) (superfamily II helicase)
VHDRHVAPAKRASVARQPAAALPVARIAVDLPLAHLDRPFDYLLTEEQAAGAIPGCRVRVRFAGQLVSGYVLDRAEASEHTGRLAYVERVVSPEPVLAPEIATLARAVADRWAGTFADVVRLAVPPRHAATEARPSAPAGAADAAADPSEYAEYGDGPAFLAALAAGESPRAALTALPGDWPATIATAVAATVASGRGVVVVVPDHRDVARVERALGDQAVALTADLGPAERYRRFLAVRRGAVRCVVGTRAAVWAPVADLGLVVVWDDGDDLHAEPRAPYCHARDVAVLRAHHAHAGLLLAGFARSVEAASLVQSGWLASLEPTPAARTAVLPAVRASGDDDDLARDPAARAARLPSLAWQAARDALAAGAPVLVQVPRRGYLVSLACAGCRAPARCGHCAGPLARAAAESTPACRWCGQAAADWTCPHCGRTAMRAAVVGAARTAEELGRAFPGVPVRTSGGDAVLADVPARPALVVATPGAEPVAAGGYGAALLLDAWVLLSRADLRASEEALRRWLGAAALVRPASEGGRVVAVAPGELRAVQALVRWRPEWLAARELDERTTLRLPPAVRMAALTGTPAAMADLLATAQLPEIAETLGPVPVPPAHPGGASLERMLVRVPRRDGNALAAALKAALATRSARKADEPVKVELDPAVLV